MGRSRSSRASNTTNVSGTNGIDGDNLGVAISGVNGSNINVSMTDHGAMERAAELGELALNSNVEVSKAALNSNAEVSKSAMDLGRDALKTNAEVSNNAMKHVSNAHGENLQMLAGLAGNQAAQNARNLATVTELAAMKTDGGQVATSKQMVMLVGMILLFMTVMAYAGSKK